MYTLTKKYKNLKAQRRAERAAAGLPPPPLPPPPGDNDLTDEIINDNIRIARRNRRAHLLNTPLFPPDHPSYQHQVAIKQEASHALSGLNYRFDGLVRDRILGFAGMSGGRKKKYRKKTRKKKRKTKRKTKKSRVKSKRNR